MSYNCETGRLQLTYSIGAFDFLDMAERLGAKVVYGERRQGDPPPGVMVMQAGAISLTLTADESVSPGEVCREEPAAP